MPDGGRCRRPVPGVPACTLLHQRGGKLSLRSRRGLFVTLGTAKGVKTCRALFPRLLSSKGYILCRMRGLLKSHWPSRNTPLPVPCHLPPLLKVRVLGLIGDARHSRESDAFHIKAHACSISSVSLLSPGLMRCSSRQGGRRFAPFQRWGPRLLTAEHVPSSIA